jgi:hypothetical protein
LKSSCEKFSKLVWNDLSHHQKIQRVREMRFLNWMKITELLLTLSSEQFVIRRWKVSIPRARAIMSDWLVDWLGDVSTDW